MIDWFRANQFYLICLILFLVALFVLAWGAVEARR